MIADPEVRVELGPGAIPFEPSPTSDTSGAAYERIAVDGLAAGVRFYERLVRNADAM